MTRIKLFKTKGEHRWNSKVFFANEVYEVNEKEAQYLIEESKVAFDIDSDTNKEKLKNNIITKIPKSSNPKLKIAVIRIGGIGDSLILGMISKAVKRKYPDSEITAFVRDKSGSDSLTNNPYINIVTKTLNQNYDSLLDKVLKLGYDIIFDNRYVTKVIYKTPGLFIEEKKKTDSLFNEYKEFYNTFPLSNNNLSKYCRINERQLSLITANLEGTDDDLYFKVVPEDFIFNAFLKDKKYITIHNASDLSRQTKSWTTNGWNKLVELIKSKHNFEVIQLGSKYEETIKGTINLTGQTSLQQTASLLSKSLFHIDTEGGLVHLARAVGTRSIVLFGCTPIHFFGYDANINIPPTFECKEGWWKNDMWWKSCAEKYPYPVPCMESIQPENIISKIKDILEMPKLKNEIDYNPDDINEQFAIDVILDENHYKAEQCQWDRIQTIMAKVKGKKILEIGCGDGYCLQELNKQGFETYGIEISKIRLDRCLKQGLNVIEGDIHNLPYPDNFFDTVIAAEVLEHIPSISKGLAECERVCKKDGRIIISLPISDIHRQTKMHLWGIEQYTILRNKKEDMTVMVLEKINGNEK